MVRRSISDFTTSLLDLCSCALGSVILLMVLLVPSPGSSGADNDPPIHRPILLRIAVPTLLTWDGTVSTRVPYSSTNWVWGRPPSPIWGVPLFTSQRTSLRLSLGQGSPSVQAISSWVGDIGSPDLREDVPGLGLVHATRTLDPGLPKDRWEDKSMGRCPAGTVLHVGAEVIEVRLTLGPGMQEPWPLHLVAVLNLSGIPRELPNAVDAFLATFQDWEGRLEGTLPTPSSPERRWSGGRTDYRVFPSVSALILPDGVGARGCSMLVPAVEPQWEMVLRYGDLAPGAPGLAPPPLPSALVADFALQLGPPSAVLGGAVSSIGPTIRGTRWGLPVSSPSQIRTINSEMTVHVVLPGPPGSDAAGDVGSVTIRHKVL